MLYESCIHPLTILSTLPSAVMLPNLRGYGTTRFLSEAGIANIIAALWPERCKAFDGGDSNPRETTASRAVARDPLIGRAVFKGEISSDTY